MRTIWALIRVLATKYERERMKLHVREVLLARQRTGVER